MQVHSPIAGLGDLSQPCHSAPLRLFEGAVQHRPMVERCNTLDFAAASNADCRLKRQPTLPGLRLRDDHRQPIPGEISKEWPELDDVALIKFGCGNQSRQSRLADVCRVNT